LGRRASRARRTGARWCPDKESPSFSKQFKFVTLRQNNLNRVYDCVASLGLGEDGVGRVRRHVPPALVDVRSRLALVLHACFFLISIEEKKKRATKSPFLLQPSYAWKLVCSFSSSSPQISSIRRRVFPERAISPTENLFLPNTNHLYK